MTLKTVVEFTDFFYCVWRHKHQFKKYLGVTGKTSSFVCNKFRNLVFSCFYDLV